MHITHRIPGSAPYTLPRSVAVNLVSPHRDVDYQVMVSWPAGAETGQQRCPVVYLLDGNALFGIATETVRRMGPSAGRTAGVLPEPVVVAIGYPDTVVTNPRRRTEDYTPSLAPHVQAPLGRDGQPQPYGGAARFLGFVEQVVKPWVASHFAIDSGRQALMGHSLGGLCVLHALFNGIGHYRDYVAISPSIWWGEQAILADEAHYAASPAAVGVPEAAVRLWLSVGAAEQGPRSVSAATGLSHAQALAERLSQLGRPGLQVAFRLHEGEDHGSVVPVGVSRALLSWLSAG